MVALRPLDFFPNKFPRQHVSEAVAEEETEKQKTKKKLASPSSNRIWNEEDELIVLKGLVDYRAKAGFQAKSYWDDFYHRFIGDSIVAKFSKEQLLGKIRKMKMKFFVHMEKNNQGKEPVFTKPSDAKAFEYSNMIWGLNDYEFVNHQNKIREETPKEDEQMANVEPLNENVAANDGNDDDADESCAVRDAFEATMSQSLSDYQKKVHLEKLMNVGSEKRKELSDEWKVLCAEEANLNIKKFRFSAKLAEAANDM
ncbi:unnamed protein product [Thlaspi arvense]|uniref:Glabrous enhancer-binding protein-like DBD domain-containing protein n=1 Tax=Thlaspi arvense TaxID=13288 RepID=A0AAU9TAM6_THLAR|nr:unnamed protein product [Thlaspi arvense]